VAAADVPVPVAQWLGPLKPDALATMPYATQAASAPVVVSSGGPAEVTVQLASGPTLVLTANEVFFDTPGRLPCVAATPGPGAAISDWNGGASFQSVGRWSKAGDKMKWGFVLDAVDAVLFVDVHVASAPLPVQLVACVDDADDAWLDGKLVPQRVQLPKFPCTSPGARFSISGLRPGFHTLSLWLASSITGAPLLSQVRITISAPGASTPMVSTPTSGISTPTSGISTLNLGTGTPITGTGTLGVARLRWRPNAAHVSFRASAVPKPQAWVFCLRKAGSTLGAYSPMTTPFGYMGDTFAASDQPVPGGMNFSLWSYRANAPEPPLHQHACLLGIGHPTAEFSRFTHEGTGVKVRNFTGQWTGNTTGDFVYYCDMARVPPAADGEGTESSTYRFRSFFWDDALGTWRFYAEGEQYFANKTLDALPLSGFIEVPGGAALERSGHVRRAVAYYGYASPGAGTWFPVDGMNVVEGGTTGTKSWKVNGTGDRFVVSTGGFLGTAVPLPAKHTMALPTPRPAQGDQAPLFMQRISQIKSPPYPTLVAAETARVTDTAECTECVVRVPVDTDSVTVFWGPTDGRTFVHHWLCQQTFPQTRPITVPVAVPGPDVLDKAEFRDVHVSLGHARDVAKYARIFVKTPAYQLFSIDTATLGTQ
jgi:hypothetical protein